jgi:hypothetical protein
MVGKVGLWRPGRPFVICVLKSSTLPKLRIQEQNF